ncbi:g7988 [Coccomyxa elongata]
MLLSGDTFTDCEARHDSLCDILRRTHGASSLPRHSYGLPPLTAADLADRADGAQCTAAPARQRQRLAIPPGFEPRDTASLAAQHAAQVALTGLPAVRRSAREQDGGLARKAALSAMTRPRQPTLRLLSLNVNGLQDKDKRRWLFNLLERDKWDVILTQETHHRSPEEGAAWAQEGPNGLRCNWSGPAFWCHYTSQSRGVAILFRATATTSNLTVRHSSATGRTLSVDFTFSGLPYTAVCVYAPSVATDRPHYYTQELLPSLPPDRHLLVGGDFNCIAGQQDMLDPASPPGQRTLGYWTGMRHVETDHSLYDVWRDLNSDRRTFTHIATSGQSAACLDRWLLSEQLRARVSKEPHAIGHVIGYPGDHLGVNLSLTAPASTLYAKKRNCALKNLSSTACSRELSVPAYLGAHPLGPDLTRGRRWEDLKRQVKDIALQRSWALAAQQRASLKVLEADSRAAMAAYSRSPSAETTLLAWQDAHQLLQALNAEAAKGAALHAGVVWQFHGEQSTFWFHHLARDRQSRTELKALRAGAAPDSPRIVLDTPAGRDQGGDILRDYYSGDSATGRFAAHPVSEAAQAELLQAEDMFLPPEAAATAEGANGDGRMPAAELEAALRSLPRGKAPGMDGIPYEFYQRFWPALGQELTDVLHEAFITEASPALPPLLLQGRITLLYNGKGADRESPASYRPITLLNTDYKLAARTLANRLGPVLNHVVDATQTGFLPKRWVGDNVLAHLEEISYLQETQEPGVMVFLDFEKAFDRLDRAWIERCMAAVGFGPGAQRWVHILHSGTTARVAYNGWHTDAFPVRDAQDILDTSVDFHCAATGSKLQRGKFQCLSLGSLSHLTGPDAATRVTLAAQGASVKTLGIPLSKEPADAATALFRAILQKVELRIARWSGFSLLGRAYVAKQVLASMLPEHLLTRLCRALHTFVAANKPVIGGT